MRQVALLEKSLGIKKSQRKILKFLKVLVLRDSTISIMILMSIVYVILALLAGTSYVEHELSNGENAIIFSLIQAGTFTAGFVVVLQGVRMVLGEIVPAFQGIAKN